MTDSVNRFSNRVENYAKFRPGYPSQIVKLLEKECGLTRESIIADIGSGTGIFSEILLKNGNKVIGVEPGTEMRAAAEALLKGYERFRSVGGTAEQTNLESESINMITAAQAFHWFDREKARQEFVRILKPGGWVVLIWNERRMDSTPFLEEYEELLLKFGTDYQRVRHENVRESIAEFFAPGIPFFEKFDNAQLFDLIGLQGRVASSSYAPTPGRPGYEPMLARLEEIFTKHARDGKVTFEYDTTVYYGKLPPK